MVTRGRSGNAIGLHQNIRGGSNWPTNAGWILQGQTNNLAVGLSTNWVEVPGSSALTSVTNTVNPANGSVFYRLRFP